MLLLMKFSPQSDSEQLARSMGGVSGLLFGTVPAMGSEHATEGRWIVGRLNSSGVSPSPADQLVLILQKCHDPGVMTIKEISLPSNYSHFHSMSHLKGTVGPARATLARSSHAKWTMEDFLPVKSKWRNVFGQEMPSGLSEKYIYIF